LGHSETLKSLSERNLKFLLGETTAKGTQQRYSDNLLQIAYETLLHQYLGFFSDVHEPVEIQLFQPDVCVCVCVCTCVNECVCV